MGNPTDPVIVGIGEVEIAIGVDGNVAREVKCGICGGGAFAREACFAVSGDGNQYIGSPLARAHDGSDPLIACVGDVYFARRIDGDAAGRVKAGDNSIFIFTVVSRGSVDRARLGGDQRGFDVVVEENSPNEVVARRRRRRDFFDLRRA